MSNIPKLRFKEFGGEWKALSLKDITSLITKGTTPSYFTDSGISFVKIEGLVGTNIDKSKCLFINKNVHEKELKRSILEENDILFAIAGATIGKVCVVTSDILPANTNQALAIIRLKHEQSITFVLQVLQSDVMRQYIKENISVGAQPNLNLQQIGHFSFYTPTLFEQSKIATFLTAIDTKIDQMTRKKELLEQYKNGVMQKIFSQELRFKADNGSEFPEWEEKKIGDYLIHKSTKNKNNEIGLVLSVSNKKGFISQEEQFDGYEVASSDITTYKIVAKGDYAYNPSRINVGSIARLDKFDIGVVSPMYVVFGLKKDLHPLFFDNLYQTHRFKHAIKKACSGSVRDSLNFNDLADFDVLLPYFEEQTKIANFFSAIDTKIDFATKQLEEVKKFKKGLLQQMFV